MGGLYFLLPTLLVIFVSFLIIRAAAIALMMTGMDEKRAGFQALSAFSGTGFTTKEAELVINYPLRRRIITWLMILGNVGIVTVIVTTTTSLVTSKGFTLPINVVILLLGIYVIYRVATRKGFIKRWENYIKGRLIKSHAFEEGIAEDLLHLIEGYGLVRVTIKEDHPFIGCSLLECKLTKKGLLVLGIERGKSWIPIPKAREKMNKGDNIIVYGPLKVLRSLFREK